MRCAMALLLAGILLFSVAAERPQPTLAQTERRAVIRVAGDFVIHDALIRSAQALGGVVFDGTGDGFLEADSTRDRCALLVQALPVGLKRLAPPNRRAGRAKKALAALPVPALTEEQAAAINNIAVDGGFSAYSGV